MYIWQYEHYHKISIKGKDWIFLISDVVITPVNQMNETFARRVTGGENLSTEQKSQIQYQQQVLFN